MTSKSSNRSSLCIIKLLLMILLLKCKKCLKEQVHRCFVIINIFNDKEIQTSMKMFRQVELCN